MPNHGLVCCGPFRPYALGSLCPVLAGIAAADGPDRDEYADLTVAKCWAPICLSIAAAITCLRFLFPALSNRLRQHWTHDSLCHPTVFGHDCTLFRHAGHVTGSA
jgi:hypothetical protein